MNYALVTAIGSPIAATSFILRIMLLMSHLVSGCMARRRRDTISARDYRLYNEAGGHYLEILDDGRIAGSRIKHIKSELEVYSKWVTKRRLSNSFEQTVWFKGKENGMFLCMNRHGSLYGSKVFGDECEFFEESFPQNSVCWFYSRRWPQKGVTRGRKAKHSKWFIGLDRRTGKSIFGHKARLKQKRVRFVKMPLEGTEDGTSDPYKDVFQGFQSNGFSRGHTSSDSNNNDNNVHRSLTTEPPKIVTVTTSSLIETGMVSSTPGSNSSQVKQAGRNDDVQNSRRNKHNNKQKNVISKNNKSNGHIRTNQHERTKTKSKDLFEIIMESVLKT